MTGHTTRGRIMVDVAAMNPRIVTDQRLHRILLVVQTSVVGGMETHCVDLAAEYVRRGLCAAVLLPVQDRFDDLALRFKQAGADVHRLVMDGREGRVSQLRG